jgi:hypothetical protein
MGSREVAVNYINATFVSYSRSHWASCHINSKTEERIANSRECVYVISDENKLKHLKLKFHRLFIDPEKRYS